MTPYQRGQRDGLLAVAAELDDITRRARRSADTWSAMARGGNTDACRNARAVATGDLLQEGLAHDIASLCRRRAESLPDDPEEKP